MGFIHYKFVFLYISNDFRFICDVTGNGKILGQLNTTYTVSCVKSHQYSSPLHCTALRMLLCLRPTIRKSNWLFDSAPKSWPESWST